ncbi:MULTISPECIES: GNAT family N-acetyltransferase [unclassified Streptomyces]|uniref:GNAT family N-acetyltransferase n=1 Tax=unclassified Streptomyces TaxID=2593676 RepID=UPI00225BD9F2|nr:MULTISPECIES: GNAT family protein [unclassified Streptomyces]MCX5280748.1 GNAT family N-acetyltransferase [Streptomyces sp. NBC_00198]
MHNWPLTGITVRTPLVELRHPTPQDLDALADLGAEGVHTPGFMPFFSQWTDGDPATVARRVLQRHWRAMADWTADDWTLYLVVVHEGEVVGSQSLGARDFAVTGEVLLTSWLGLRHQGLGLGGHARAASLELAFTGLGAQDAFSVVRRGNTASQAVCRKFGFTHDGTQINAVRGERAVSDRYRLTRADWAAARTVPAEIAGLEPALDLFGAASTSRPVQAPSGSLSPALAATLSGVRYAPEPDHADV